MRGQRYQRKRYQRGLGPSNLLSLVGLLHLIGEGQQLARPSPRPMPFLFTSGAGMRCDSGLPNFRDTNGFWRSYPPMKKLNIKFEEMSNPDFFETDAPFAWGFWSHRIGLYFKSANYDATLIRINPIDFEAPSSAFELFFSFFFHPDSLRRIARPPKNSTHSCFAAQPIAIPYCDRFSKATMLCYYAWVNKRPC